MNATIRTARDREPFPYVWYWRKHLPGRKGQRCRVLTRSRRMNSALIEFEDGFRVVTSRNALRRVDPTPGGSAEERRTAALPSLFPVQQSDKGRR